MLKRTVFILLAAFFTVMACAGTNNLRTNHIPSPEQLTGQCDLILYTAYEDEMELKLAVLDIKGDGYMLKPFASVKNFKTFKGLSVAHALKKAEEFLSTVTGYDQMEVRRVNGPGGEVVAYEARPLYEPFFYGPTDVTQTSYYISEEGVIKFIVRTDLPRRMRMILDRGR